MKDHKLVPLRPPESILAVVRKAYGNATAYDVGHVWHEIYTRLPDAAPVQEPVHKLIYPGGGKALFDRLWHLTCNAVATQSGMRVRTNVLPMQEMKEFLDHLCALVDSPPQPVPAPVQEQQPVAWASQTAIDIAAEGGEGIIVGAEADCLIPLYAVPQPAPVQEPAKKLWLQHGVFPDLADFDANGLPRFYSKESAAKFQGGQCSKPCTGKNCGSMNGWMHSIECRAEHEAVITAHQPAPVQEHWSDCATNNEPAYPAGDCNCHMVQCNLPRSEEHKRKHAEATAKIKAVFDSYMRDKQ